MNCSISFQPPYAGEDNNIWMTRDSNLGERATQADALSITSRPERACLYHLLIKATCSALLMRFTDVAYEKSIVRDRTHDLSIWDDHSNHQAAEMTAAAIWDDEENFLEGKNVAPSSLSDAASKRGLQQLTSIFVKLRIIQFWFRLKRIVWPKIVTLWP